MNKTITKSILIIYVFIAIQIKAYNQINSRKDLYTFSLKEYIYQEKTNNRIYNHIYIDYSEQDFHLDPKVDSAIIEEVDLNNLDNILTEGQGTYTKLWPIDIINRDTLYICITEYSVQKKEENFYRYFVLKSFNIFFKFNCIKGFYEFVKSEYR